VFVVGLAATCFSQSSEGVFDREMRLAEQSQDRDQAVAHMEKALISRPNNPANIIIEYRIGVLLSQVRGTSGQVLRRDEAIKYFKSVVENYDHMSYYRGEPEESVSSPEFMVPRAQLQLGSLMWGYAADPEKAQRYLMMGMENVNATYQKRITDWLQAPKPQPETFSEGAGAEEKYQARVVAWQKRRDAAARGEVLGEQETNVARELVRQYGYSYGPQHSEEVPAVMRAIVEKFPNTPMAKFAKEHIAKASEITSRQVDDIARKQLQQLGSNPSEKPLVGESPASSRKVVSAEPSTKGWLLWIALTLGALGVCFLLWRRQRRAA
jgi:hypothetical protein